MAIPDWAFLGAEVMCTKPFVPRARDLTKPTLPKVGKTYTIRGFIFARSIVGIRLMEIMNPEAPYVEGQLETGFMLSHFKPVYRQGPQREVERELFLSNHANLLKAVADARFDQRG